MEHSNSAKSKNGDIFTAFAFISQSSEPAMSQKTDPLNLAMFLIVK